MNRFRTKKTRFTRQRVSALATIALPLVLIACDFDDGPVEEAGAELDDAYEESVERVERVTEQYRDDVEQFKRESGAALAEAQQSLERETDDLVAAATETTKKAGDKLEAATADAAASAEQAAEALRKATEE